MRQVFPWVIIKRCNNACNTVIAQCDVALCPVWSVLNTHCLLRVESEIRAGSINGLGLVIRPDYFTESCVWRVERLAEDPLFYRRSAVL